MTKRQPKYLRVQYDKNETDTHHKIGQCNKSWANVGRQENLMKIKKNVHHALNTLFTHNQSPHEQLQQLREMYNSVLSDEAKNIFDNLLSLEKQNFYKKELIK